MTKDEEEERLAELQRLDKEYTDLEKKEALLRQALQQLEHEQGCLSRAISSATSTSTMQSQEVQAEAERRLQQALFDASSSDEESSKE
jgi:hypothetical protein